MHLSFHFVGIDYDTHSLASAMEGLVKKMLASFEPEGDTFRDIKNFQETIEEMAWPPELLALVGPEGREKEWTDVVGDADLATIEKIVGKLSLNAIV